VDNTGAAKEVEDLILGLKKDRQRLDTRIETLEVLKEQLCKDETKHANMMKMIEKNLEERKSARAHCDYTSNIWLSPPTMFQKFELLY